MLARAGLVTSYGDFAAGLVAQGILSDAWVDGVPRFRMTPVVIDRPTERALYAAAEGIAAAHAEGARLCARRPDLVARYFDLPPAYRLMWEASAPAWHGIARADVFLTDGGPQVCELNSDTPSGEPEAYVLNQMIDGAGAVLLDDPNRDLADDMCGMLAAMGESIASRAVGIVYPTEMTEDLPMIELYARWLEARGLRVVLGSPFNLHADGAGGVAMFGVPCGIVFRHYKTDWWGERLPIRRSQEPYADPEPLRGPLDLLLGAVARGRCAVVNPFGAVLTQNKRMMALLWEELDLLPTELQGLVRRFLPYTARLESLPVARLRDEKDLWVLKSDYGCEGEEVVVGAETSRSDWATVLADVLPRRWIAQRRFHPRAARGRRPANFGVYVIGGRAAGLFTRLQAGTTDRHAVCAPTFVRRSGGGAR